MKKKLPGTGVRYEIEATDEPLIARGGLVLPYEMARALRLPQMIDGKFRPPEADMAMLLRSS